MLNLNKKKKYLLACSFGPDSMALFDMLEKEGFNFSIAHVNYGVREEAKQETIDLNNYSAKHDKEIEILYDKSLLKGKNFEARARKIRYEFFKKIYDQGGFDALLVAHQQDDNLETYFLQLQRKSLVETYGLNEETKIFEMNVIRPLLNYSKKELKDYCDNNNVPYAIDKTNEMDIYKRNIIRHKIVEKMNDIEKKNELDEIYKKNENIKSQYTFLCSTNLNDVNSIIGFDDELFARAIVLLFRKLKKDASLSLNFINEIKKALKSPKPNINIKINAKHYFVKEYSWCGFKRKISEKDYSYEIPQPMIFETKYFSLDFKRQKGSFIPKKEDYPITIRNVQPNDKIHIASYDVNAKRLLIDWKMPLSLRKKWPVILNKSGQIIYCPRYRKDFTPNANTTFIVKI